jgi:hypothetical protein
MSYEGCTKILCEKGHLYAYDAYDTPHVSSWTCPYCGSGQAWIAHIDQTNGNDDATGRCPGDVKLRVRNNHKCKCKCGHVHAKEPIQYFIPK